MDHRKHNPSVDLGTDRSRSSHSVSIVDVLSVSSREVILVYSEPTYLVPSCIFVVDLRIQLSYQLDMIATCVSVSTSPPTLGHCATAATTPCHAMGINAC